MQVYYVSRIDDNTFYLQESMRLNQGNINLSDSYPAGSYPHDGTWTFGAHNLGLVYNIRREYKSWHQMEAYQYTYYNDHGGTYSGYDFNQHGSYGRGGTGWDRVVFLATNRPGYDGGRDYFHINRYYWNRINCPRTYGYHHENLPFSTSERYNGTYDFLTTKDSMYINDNGSNEHGRAYTIQGWNSNLTSTFYYRDTFYCQYMNAQHMMIRGNEFYYWGHQEHWSATLDRYFGNYSEDGQCNNLSLIHISEPTRPY